MIRQAKNNHNILHNQIPSKKQSIITLKLHDNRLRKVKIDTENPILKTKKTTPPISGGGN